MVVYNNDIPSSFFDNFPRQSQSHLFLAYKHNSVSSRPGSCCSLGAMRMDSADDAAQSSDGGVGLGRKGESVVWKFYG